MAWKGPHVTDPYIDPSTGVLRNRLGIADDASLQAAESAVARINASTAVQFAESARHLNETALKGIHRILFSEIFDWAGEFRTVYLKKAAGGLPFEAPDQLSGAMKQRILPPMNRLARRAGRDNAVFVAALAKCWGDLNKLHPFREGNGRATQIFMAAIARRYDRDLDFSKIDHTSEQAAAIASMSGNNAPYEVLIAQALMAFDRSLLVDQFWVERDFGPNS
jgi:cell filamentation protein